MQNHPTEPDRAPTPRRYPAAVTLRDGTCVTIRPIGPQDEAREQAFVRALSPESRYFRFMNTLRELSPGMLERFTHPDPQREIALVAVTGAEPDLRQVGVARCVIADDGVGGEFAIVVADAMQGKGLGWCLMQELLAAGRARGMQRMEGLVLASNHPMLQLMQALGFSIDALPEDPRMRRVVKQLA